MQILFFLLALCMPLAVLPKEEEPVVILGGGVGALTSAIYLARSGLHPIVIEGKEPGGLLTQSHAVQNWPGEVEIVGSDLTEKIRRQAEGNGAVFLQEEVVGIDFSKRPLTVTTRALDGSGQLKKTAAQSCIIAMGTEPNFLGVPGESAYWGHGVSNCAVCDGTLYRDQVVGVVGGGDAAVLEALYLSDLAREVHLFVRKGAFRATDKKRLQLLRERDNVRIHLWTSVAEVKGDGENLNAVYVKQGDGATREVAMDGLFLAIGSKPNTELFRGVLALDEQGYIALKRDQRTSMDGVFAIGDIVDPVYKQAISAAGDGAKAALQAKQYLSDLGLQTATLVRKQETPPSSSHDVMEITSYEQLQQELKSSSVPIVVDFYASWCGPCKRLSPLLELSAQHLEGKVRFLKVNVDRCRELSQEYQIRAMPTVLMFDPTGKVIDKKIGSEEISLLLQELESNNYVF